jgi:predicted Zn-dependent protease
MQLVSSRLKINPNECSRSGGRPLALPDDDYRRLASFCQGVIKQGQWGKALILLDCLACLDPQNLVVALWQIEVYLRLGRSDEAEMILGQLETTHPSSMLVVAAQAAHDLAIFEVQRAAEGIERVLLEDPHASSAAGQWARELALRLDTLLLKSKTDAAR